MVSIDNVLREGITLKNGEFVIHGILGQGGFGITYEAEKVKLKKRVVLKELFIKDKCEREEDGKTVFVMKNNRYFFERQKVRFFKEAQLIASLDNPHIVQVHDVFEENNTVYYEMDFVEGESLGDIVKRTRRPLHENKVKDILYQLLDALDCIHGQKPPLCHLDIKPANIMMKDEDQIVLIDFGASKYVASSDKEMSSSSFVAYTPGYAPVEQLDGNRDEMGPWTDFYALGATLFCLFTAKKPASPSVIDGDNTPNKRYSIPMPDTVSPQMRKLVLWMMALSKSDRPQSVKEIRDFLNDRKTPKKANLKPWLVATVLALALIFVFALTRTCSHPSLQMTMWGYAGETTFNFNMNDSIGRYKACKAPEGDEYDIERKLKLHSYNPKDGKCIIDAYLEDNYIGQFDGTFKEGGDGEDYMQSYEGKFYNKNGKWVNFRFTSVSPTEIGN